MPKSIVVESAFTWGDDRPPRIPWSRTVIYECHVKGLTRAIPTCRNVCAVPISDSPPIP
jgi:glycogen operon protein